jgi:hypothetical protein
VLSQLSARKQPDRRPNEHPKTGLAIGSCHTCHWPSGPPGIVCGPHRDRPSALVPGSTSGQKKGKRADRQEEPFTITGAWGYQDPHAGSSEWAPPPLALNAIPPWSFFPRRTGQQSPFQCPSGEKSCSANDHRASRSPHLQAPRRAAQYLLSRLMFSVNLREGER